MKVLLIAPTADGDDVGESWVGFQWIRLLADVAEVTVLVSVKKGHRPPEVPGVRVIAWPEPPLVDRFERLNSLLQPGYVWFHARARRWIRRSGESFDVAHQVIPVAMRYPSPVAGLGIPFVLGPVGGSLTSPPGFVDDEGSTPWYQRLRRLDRWRLRNDPLLRHTYESADTVLGIAPYVQDLLKGVQVRRLELMPEVAVDAAKPPVERRGRTGTVRLLQVGRIVRTKGLRDAIQAMASLRDLDVHLDAVGDGFDRAACEQLVASLGLGDRVTFHGRTPRVQVDEFYRRADIFVFPSYREPGGGVVMEAMSYGLPSVLCLPGGPGANTTDEVAIRLDAVDPDQLAADVAAALRRLVENPELRLGMGEAARAHVTRHHLWSKRVEQLLAIYEQISR